MRTTIGPFDPATGTVSVLFSHAGVKHRRPVNAVIGAAGYDAAETKARVKEVAAGVIRKIEVGAIVNAPPTEPETPTPPEE